MTEEGLEQAIALSDKIKRKKDGIKLINELFEASTAYNDHPSQRDDFEIAIRAIPRETIKSAFSLLEEKEKGVLSELKIDFDEF